MNLVFSLLALILLSVSCKKKNLPPISQQEMWDCHNQKTWDAIDTRDELIGKWSWEFISCYSDPENGSSTEHEGLTIEFKEDGTLAVTNDGLVTDNILWRVIDGDANLYAVIVEPPVSQLYGRILFCDNRVEFNNSYIDVCDNYFIRL